MPRKENSHREHHRVDRIGWLRAAVLGANDGIVSTASLLVGVLAARQDPSSVLLTGVAGLVAGAMSMAAGEYVSVHSQADTEEADLHRERIELESDPEAEHRELTAIYLRRGVPHPLADQVASALMQHDALDAHARDELGITPGLAANPLQAAASSAASFAVGAALPIGVAWLTSGNGAASIWWIAAVSILLLCMLGGIAARAGGAGVLRGAGRVGFWGAFAMAITASAGKLFGAVA